MAWNATTDRSVTGAPQWGGRCVSVSALSVGTLGRAVRRGADDLRGLHRRYHQRIVLDLHRIGRGGLQGIAGFDDSSLIVGGLLGRGEVVGLVGHLDLFSP